MVEDREAIAAADDFAARLLRLDQGVEAILDAVKRWPRRVPDQRSRIPT
jgi:hypothetical protein